MDANSLLPELSEIQKPPFISKFAEGSLAEYQYKILMNQIKDFENNLDQDHEVMLLMSSFGKSVEMYVEKIGYANPSLIIFKGFVGKKYSILIQHVNQLSFLITSVEKPTEAYKPRRIGFYDPSED